MKVPTRALGVLAVFLAASAGVAQNLVLNPGPEPPLEPPWMLLDQTRVAGFPGIGGVNLGISSVFAGGMSQCIDLSGLPEGARLEGGMTVTLFDGTSGSGVELEVVFYPGPGCSGTPIEAKFLGDGVDIGKTPNGLAVLVNGSVTVPSGARSVEFRVLGHILPGAEMTVNVRDLFLRRAEGAAPQVRPSPSRIPPDMLARLSGRASS